MKQIIPSNLKMPKPTVKRSSLVMISLWGASIIVGLITYPLAKKIPQLHTELNATRADLSNIKSTSAQVRQLSGQLNELTTKEQALTRAIPDSGNAPVIFEQIQKVATDSAVSLNSLNYSGETGQTKITSESTEGSVSLGIVVGGTFERLTKFLETIENASPILTPQNLNLATNEGGEVSMSIPLTADFLFVPPLSGDKLIQIDLSILNSPQTTTATQNALGRQEYKFEVDTKSGIGKRDPFVR